MPRQTFISKEFFVPASEIDIRHILLALPRYTEDVKFVNQHSVTATITFLYQRAEDKKVFRVLVSLLPLHQDCTQINLHIAHTNEQAFYYDKSIEEGLNNFESVILAALQGDMSLYRPRKQEEKSTKKLIRIVQSIIASTGDYLIWKKG